MEGQHLYGEPTLYEDAYVSLIHSRTLLLIGDLRVSRQGVCSIEKRSALGR